MLCTCRNAIRAEREAIADYLDHRGQRYIADRIRNGEHHRPHAVVAEPGGRARGMEDDRGWEDGA